MHGAQGQTTGGRSEVAAAPVEAGLLSSLGSALKSWHAAMLTAPIPFFVFTVQGRMVMLNEAFVSVTGYREADLSDIRQWLLKMRRVGEADVDSVIQGWLRKFAQGEPTSTERSIWTAWGEKRSWIIHTGSPVIWLDGSQVVIATAVDMTDERRLEGELLRSQDEMRVRLAELESLYKTAPLGLGMLDRNFKFVRSNDALSLIDGIVVADHVGRSVFEILPGLRGRGERLMQQVLETGIAVKEEEFHDEKSDRVWNKLFYPMRDASGATIGLGIMCTEITERKRSEERIAQAHASLRRTLDLLFLALRTAGVSVFAQDVERRFSWLGGDLFGVRTGDIIGARDEDVLPAQLVEPSILAKQRVLETGEPVHVDLPYTIDGQIVWCNLRIEAWRDEAGEIIGLLGAISDISERKGTEEHIRTLMNELAHRSKNLLTVIQIMARRSATPDQSSVDFVESFVDRLKGIAQSQDLLSRDDWRGISMSELVGSQLHHLDDTIGARISVHGPNLVLTPVAAQNLGMALHELATNAVKYGALSNAQGTVSIGWDLIDDGAETRRLSLSWQEQGGPPVVAPTRRGFGRFVIETIAARALGGEVSLTFSADGVRCHIDAAGDDSVLAAAGGARP